MDKLIHRISIVVCLITCSNVLKSQMFNNVTEESTLSIFGELHKYKNQDYILGTVVLSNDFGSIKLGYGKNIVSAHRFTIIKGGTDIVIVKSKENLPLTVIGTFNIFFEAERNTWQTAINSYLDINIKSVPIYLKTGYSIGIFRGINLGLLFLKDHVYIHSGLRFNNTEKIFVFTLGYSFNRRKSPSSKEIKLD